MIRRRVTLAVLFLLAILSVAHHLAAQEVIDLPGRDKPLEADFEEIFRVGVMDGEDWEMFGHVHAVAFDGSGNLYVIDGLATGMTLPGGRGEVTIPTFEGVRVLVFDASGNFVREFGSAGEGPGEFNVPVGFAVMRDGTTVVGDRGHRAYQLFDADGRFLRMVRGRVDRRTMLPDPRGGGVFKGHSDDLMISVSSSGGGTPPPPPTSRPVVRLDLGGDEVRADTVVEGWLPPRGTDGFDLPIVLPPGTEGSRDVQALVRRALGSQVPGPVFEPPFLVGVLSDGSVVHSDSSAYELQITPAGAGKVARVIRRPLRPKPVTRAIENDYRKTTRNTTYTVIQRVRGASPSTSGQVSNLQAPEREFYPEIPVLREIATTWEDRIWVRRRGEEWLDNGPLDVVTASGRYVGTFAADATRIPDAFGPHGMAALIVRNDLGVAGVVVLRLPAAVR